MGTKAQMIDFIMSNFTEQDGKEVSKSKLDTFKKADLEEFIKTRSSEDKFIAWIAAE